jgi:hypothetical protein
MIIKDRNTLNKKSYSGTSGLGMLEWICLIVLPVMIGYLIYMMIDTTTDMVWWLNLIITICLWSLLAGVVWLFSWYASDNDWR